MNVKDFFTDEQKESIHQAIIAAEKNTSGEIRVHVDNVCKETDVVKQAIKIFDDLKMHKTKERNGILFYLSIDDHKFAIIGDKGINEKVPANFWHDVKEVTLQHFKQKQFTEGLCKGIEMTGDKLKTFFAIAPDDSDELSNELSFGEH